MNNLWCHGLSFTQSGGPKMDTSGPGEEGAGTNLGGGAWAIITSMPTYTIAHVSMAQEQYSTDTTPFYNISSWPITRLVACTCMYTCIWAAFSEEIKRR